MEHNTGMISVLTPVYNRQEYIAECIRSVLAQTYQNFEIIIADDGSTDDTLKICEELAQTEPRIRIITGDHKGVSAIRNKTLEAASGEFVFFMDSDDVIHPRLLETLVTAMQKTCAKMGGTLVGNVATTHWDKVAEAISKDTEAEEPTYHDHEDTVRCLFDGTSPIGMIGGTMMRRDLIGATRFSTDLFIGEDYYFIYENLIKGADAVFLMKRWYYGRIHKCNISNNFTLEGFLTRFHRRRLVWESEERLGRPEHALRQKGEARGIYQRFLVRNKMSKKDSKQIRNVVKTYKKELLAGSSFKAKLHFLVALYMPWVFLIYERLKKGKVQKPGMWD